MKEEYNRTAIYPSLEFKDGKLSQLFHLPLYMNMYFCFAKPFENRWHISWHLTSEHHRMSSQNENVFHVTSLPSAFLRNHQLKYIIQYSRSLSHFPNYHKNIFNQVLCNVNVCYVSLEPLAPWNIFPHPSVLYEM